MTADIII